MRDLEYQVIKLSYVEVDSALAILKSIGYTVVEFKGGKGELAGEYSFSPAVSGTLNIMKNYDNIIDRITLDDVHSAMNYIDLDRCTLIRAGTF